MEKTFTFALQIRTGTAIKEIASLWVDYVPDSPLVNGAYLFEMRNIDVLKERAENMRMRPTFHEAKFKERLEMAGIYYKTQWVIGNYIVDFLVGITVIEIDGRSHFEEEQAQYDKNRSAYLSRLGYRIIRVRNEHVVSFDMSRLKGCSHQKTKSKQKRDNRDSIEEKPLLPEIKVVRPVATKDVIFGVVDRFLPPKPINMWGSKPNKSIEKYKRGVTYK